MIEAVNIPVIRLYDSLIVSIQVALTDRLAQQRKDDITRHIERTKAQGLIIDLSAVELIDSYLSRVIRDIALVARLMGAPTVICGLQSGVAMTLVEMGMKMQGVATALSLERALSCASRTRQWADFV